MTCGTGGWAAHYKHPASRWAGDGNGFILVGPDTRSDTQSLSPRRQIIIMWSRSLHRVAHNAAMQKLHSALRSKAGTNAAATNNFIFECTPFLLFETDVLTDFWAEASTCCAGRLHLQLQHGRRGPGGSQSYYFRHRWRLRWPHDGDPAVVNTCQSCTATLTRIQKSS